jgi:glycine hydroxymethyltransferase
MSTAAAGRRSVPQASHSSRPLAESDPQVAGIVGRELRRQQDEIELIASENFVSRAVLEATGTVLTNKYAEGYPGNRYYGGCHVVDEAETLAIERAKALFKCKFANVQPHSGSTANQAAFMALMRPGDTFMGLSLDTGGHLTHGSPVNLSGKWFKVVPKVIVAGGSAYPRFIDFAAFRRVADDVGASLMVDMAHFAGLVAGGAHPSPFPHAHVVTTTTHKTLRGPRGAMILSNEEALAKKINSAVFPGMQGGPLMHIVAAKAVAFGEALAPEFKTYARNVVENAKALGEVLARAGFDLVSGGTDTHLLLVDLRPKRITGNLAEKALGRAHITVNKNAVPFDPEKPAVTSGVRIGSPAGTTRGFGIAEFQQVGRLMAEVLDGLAASGEAGNGKIEAKVKEEAVALCRRFPIYA